MYQKNVGYFQILGGGRRGLCSKDLQRLQQRRRKGGTKMARLNENVLVRCKDGPVRTRGI